MNALTWATERNACPEAIDWLRTLPAGTTMAEAWRKCARADWMLWALHRINHLSWPGPHHLACDCAERALQSEQDAVRKPDPRSWRVVEVERAYLGGKATTADLAAAREAAAEAWASAVSATGSMSSTAAAAAASWGATTAEAAWAVASASAWSARAASWRAAAGNARRAAWATERRWQADRLRHYVPEWPEV
jgi:hypothetical protein